ncbi:tyrosine-type recombinase/integrase, partial [Saliterribacillus persicus]
ILPPNMSLGLFSIKSGSVFNCYGGSLLNYHIHTKNGKQPISRQQAYRIIHRAAEEAGITEKVGMHTLRKTFGFHAYHKGIAISILQQIYGHTTPGETLRYIGVNKNQRLSIKVDVNL